eukprot:1344718-Prymnesium_polylepis.1
MGRPRPAHEARRARADGLRSAQVEAVVRALSPPGRQGHAAADANGSRRAAACRRRATHPAWAYAARRLPDHHQEWRGRGAGDCGGRHEP